MILVIIRMKVFAEKRKELSQTIALLTVSIKREKGCQRCDFCQNMEDENELFILEEWDTRENLNSHLESEHFSILRGAMNLLREPYKMVFHTVSKSLSGTLPEKQKGGGTNAFLEVHNKEFKC